jgi:hypothetical protein
MQSFIECLRKGTAPIVTVWDGVRSSIACLRMLESARTGQPARIDVASVLGVPTSNQA